jgi:predicted Zn finger-like uncharacterized protein
LFTVCPKCTLTLVVTTVDLRAGQGYVRCGRCANVFNALIALREGEPGGSISDSARQRIVESPPPPPAVQPALGSGVALDPEPEPEPMPGVAEYDLSFESADTEAPPEEGSLEFDATATDVSDIFVSPPQAEHDTGSGSYEAVVLEVEPPPEPESITEAEPEGAAEPDDSAHTESIAADDWSLLDDDEPPADDESVIEESPFAEAQEPEAELMAEPMAEVDPDLTEETVSGDPAWVQQMFAEAEADAIRGRTAEHRAIESIELGGEDDVEEPAVVRAARDVKGVSAPSGDTVLEPLLAPVASRRPAWQYTTGIGLLVFVLILQVLHHNRRDLVLNTSFGTLVSTIYGWFGTTITPRWDLTSYTVRQLGVEAQGSDGSHLRVRLSVQNDSDRVQPLPLVRLTLTDRFDKPVATRDLEPKEYLPAKIADRRLLEPNQRIDGELHVIDPGRAAVGFEIDACLRAESGQIGCANDVRQRPPG